MMTEGPIQALTGQASDAITRITRQHSGLAIEWLDRFVRLVCVPCGARSKAELGQFARERQQPKALFWPRWKDRETWFESDVHRTAEKLR